MLEYNFAPRDRGGRVRQVLEDMVHQGRQVAASSIQKLRDDMPSDYIVPAQRMSFRERGGLVRLSAKSQEGFGLHNHAMRQVAQRAGIPWKFAENLMSMADDLNYWGSQLLVHNLNELYGRDSHSYLVRTVHEEVRGFLSNRFRRLDSAPIVEAFIQQALHYGAVPVQARCLDTKFYLKMIIPGVFEVFPGEFIALGVTFQNSDFGDGALDIKIFALRLVCSNGMIGDSLLRKIHLGGRLTDENLKFSQRTYELDTQTIVSATEDIVKGALEPAAVHARLDIIKGAAEKEIDSKKRVEAMRKASRLTKAEAAKIAEIYNAPDIEQLPAGNTSWRLSNAISLLAHADDMDPGRGLELESLAGEVAGLAEAA